MAPIRARTARRGTRRSAPYARKKKATVTAKINKVMRMVKLTKPETKKLVYSIGSTNINPSPTDVISYNIFYHTYSRGVGENQFIGSQINARGIQITAAFNNVATHSGTSGAGTAQYKFRMMIVKSDIYRTTTSLTMAEIEDASTAPNSIYRMNYDSDKLKIIAKKDVTITPQVFATGVFSAPTIVKTLKWYIPFKKIVRFQDNSAVLTDYRLKDGNYYLLIQSGSPDGSFTHVGQYSFQMKVYFTD